MITCKWCHRPIVKVDGGRTFGIFWIHPHNKHALCVSSTGHYTYHRALPKHRGGELMKVDK